MDKLKVLDLFSGIGGFSLGMERTGGFETVAFCEIDEHCHKVLNKHWPEVPIFEDVSKLSIYNIHQHFLISKCPPKIDVICGGFPCTDISVAGKQKGLLDESGNKTRSGLWFEYKRLIGEIGPRYVIIENVANLRSNGLVRVLQDLWSIGYDAEWHIISARDIGACHLRERIWIIAYPNCEPIRDGVERESWGRKDGVCGKGSTLSMDDGKNGDTHSPNSDNIRFGESFTSKEEKSQWWAEASACQRDWRKTQPRVCGVYDGISTRAYESHRKQRIKQLGNSIVPGIAEVIGNQILKYEAVKCL